MAGKPGQKKGVKNPFARVNKRNVAFSDIENTAIDKYQSDKKITSASTSIWKLTLYALKQLGYMNNE